LILESDDWGSLYLPPKSQLSKLQAGGLLTKERSPYEIFDCLESRLDLTRLFDLLSNFDDKNGNPAKITFNSVMGNPNFDKIRATGFSTYHHEHFFESYRRYYDEDCEDVWYSAISNRVMTPQFHARAHINTSRWLTDLNRNVRHTRLAFDHSYYCVRRSNSPPVDYLTAYWPDSIGDLKQIEDHLNLGIDEFERTFSFRPKTFVACSYVLPKEVERHLAKLGIKMIQTQRRHRQPIPGTATSKFPRRYLGEKNEHGQIYSVRNVTFEPSTNLSINWVDLAFQQTANAFHRKVPAIVCTHRLNYVSSQDLNNGPRALTALKNFLTKVKRDYPSVEFLDSQQLLEVMQNGGT
jgi:hypothetical protein